MCIDNSVFESIEIVSTAISNSPETFLGVLSLFYVASMPAPLKSPSSNEYPVLDNNSLRLRRFEDKGRKNYMGSQNNLSQGHKQYNYSRRMMHCNRVNPVLAEN